jgi:hypothetical protein
MLYGLPNKLNPMSYMVNAVIFFFLLFFLYARPLLPIKLAQVVSTSNLYLGDKYFEFLPAQLFMTNAFHGVP